MSFLAPLAWSALGLSTLVMAVYFLRRRPRPLSVSALFLWPQASAKPRNTWRWHKAPLGLLLLQLLALALLVGGLAQPVVFTQARGAGKLAVIVDTSASMRMRTEDGTRLDEAVRRARALVRAGADAEIALVEARAGGGVRTPLTPDAGLVERALGALGPSYLGDAPVSAVVNWVNSQAPWGEFDRVVWFTDRLPADPLWRDLPLELSLVPAGQANAAITAFAVRPQPDDSQGYEAFVALRNDAEVALSTELVLSGDGTQVLTTPVEVPPGASAQYVFPLSGRTPERLRAELLVEDGLDFDNERRFAFRPSVRPRAFWLGPGDPFLAQALRAAGVQRIVPWSEDAFPATTDLIVVNRAALPRDLRGNVLLIASTWDGVVALGEPRPLADWRAVNAPHPLLRSFNPEDVVVGQGRAVAAPEGALTLLEGRAEDGTVLPLLSAHRSEGTRLVALGFALEESNLRLTLDFPILTSNLLRWLVPLPLEAAVSVTGEPIPLEGMGDRVGLPSGEVQRTDGPAFVGTDAPGFYPLPAVAQAWAVNVPAAESLPGPRTSPETGDAPAAVSARAPELYRAAQPLWFVLAWLGLAVLGLEWLAYERGWL